MQTLRGKRVLVTGAASGIGKAIAERVAAEGAELLLVDVNPRALEDAGAALARTGAKVRTYVLDVTDTSRMVGLHEQIAEDGGPIDVLVNNAGVTRASHGMRTDGRFARTPRTVRSATRSGVSSRVVRGARAPSKSPVET